MKYKWITKQFAKKIHIIYIYRKNNDNYRCYFFIFRFWTDSYLDGIDKWNMSLLHIYKSIVNIYILEEKNIFNKVIYWIFVRWAYFVPKQAVWRLSFGLGPGKNTFKLQSFC